jgi:hypothetical protein
MANPVARVRTWFMHDPLAAPLTLAILAACAICAAVAYWQGRSDGGCERECLLRTAGRGEWSTLGGECRCVVNGRNVR